MSDPLEVEVVSIDGAPPPPQNQSPPGDDPGAWFRFDRRFAPTGRGSSLLARILGGFLVVALLCFGVVALMLVLAFQFVRSIIRAFFPDPGRPGHLSPRR